MSQTTLTFRFKIEGVLTDVTSAVLSDSLNAYGVKRTDTNAIVVTAGTVMTHIGSGTYQYGPFDDPAPGLVYTWQVKFVHDGLTEYAPFTTNGGRDSDNGYGTVAGADTYFNNRLYSNAWLNASESQKANALAQAATTINKFDYVGRKTDPNQVNEWPRNFVVMQGVLLDSTVTPNDIIIAQYELSIAFLRGLDPEREIRDIRILSRGLASVRATYDPRHTPDHTLNGVPSKIAWDYLSPYFNRDDLGNVLISRVS